MSKQMWHPRNPHCSMAARPENLSKFKAVRRQWCMTFQNKYINLEKDINNKNILYIVGD